MKQTLLVIAVLCTPLVMWAQDTESNVTIIPAPPYSVTGQLIGGYLRDVSDFEDTQNNLTVNRDQFSIAARALWRPGHLLAGGLEFGYMNFYSVANNNGGKAVRSAIPLYLVFSMTAWERVDFGLGYGVGLLSSTITGANETISSSTVSTSFFISAGYRHPITNELSIGGEARYTTFDKLDDRTMAISAVIAYRLFEY